MLFTSHSMVGAAVGAATGNPYAGFFAGFLSHHVMDSLPHFDQGSRHIIKNRAPYLNLQSEKENSANYGFDLQDWALLFIDWATAFILFAALFFISKGREPWLLILSGAFGGLLPDIIDSSPLWSKKLQEKIRIIKKYHGFHTFFHWTVPERDWIMGLGIQIALIALAFAYLAPKPETIEIFAEPRNLNLEKNFQYAARAEVVSAETVKLPILIYHSVRPHIQNEPPLVDFFDVTPEALEQNLLYLKENNFTIVSFDDLLAALSKEKKLPSKPVILTFDDGWQNQYEYAFPLLKKYGATATFFIFTNAINRKHFLSWDEIREMDKAGMTIGAHTKSHPYLFKITDENKLRDEIFGSKEILEKALGKPANYFAYPFGEFNGQIISAVEKAGFKAARSSRMGVFQTKNDLFNLKAVQVSDNFALVIKELNK